MRYLLSRRLPRLVAMLCLAISFLIGGESPHPFASIHNREAAVAMLARAFDPVFDLPGSSPAERLQRRREGEKQLQRILQEALGQHPATVLPGYDAFTLLQKANIVQALKQRSAEIKASMKTNPAVKLTPQDTAAAQQQLRQELLLRSSTTPLMQYARSACTSSTLLVGLADEAGVHDRKLAAFLAGAGSDADQFALLQYWIGQTVLLDVSNPESGMRLLAKSPMSPEQRQALSGSATSAPLATPAILIAILNTQGRVAASIMNSEPKLPEAEIQAWSQRRDQAHREMAVLVQAQGYAPSSKEFFFGWSLNLFDERLALYRHWLAMPKPITAEQIFPVRDFADHFFSDPKGYSRRPDGLERTTFVYSPDRRPTYYDRDELQAEANAVNAKFSDIIADWEVQLVTSAHIDDDGERLRLLIREFPGTRVADLAKLKLIDRRGGAMRR